VESIVDLWRLRVQAATGEVIGFTAAGLPRSSWRQANWVLDAWLEAYPAAELAVTNWGGFRAEVPPGEITVGNVVDVLPFDNTIVECEVTGAELIANLECCGGAVAGFTYTYRELAAGGREVVSVTLADGTPLQVGRDYHVLVNDFMFAGGGGYLFGQQDPDGFDTGIHWRQPVIDWTRAQGSSADDPIDTRLDDRARWAPVPDVRRVRGRFSSSGPFHTSPKATVR
jgi:2',3'-cyclic-nucleotide 2'-phosphodiesterase/3'-nucleotidase